MSIPARGTSRRESSGKLPDAGKLQAGSALNRGGPNGGELNDGDLNGSDLNGSDLNGGGLYGWCLLPAIPSSVAFARAYTRMIIARHEPGVDADAAESVISELVANALQHAYHDKASMDEVVHVEVASFGRGVVVSAFDLCDEPPVLREADQDAERGRGLRVVDALSAGWCWAPRAGGGKVVYALITDGTGADASAGACPPRNGAGR